MKTVTTLKKYAVALFMTISLSVFADGAPSPDEVTVNVLNSTNSLPSVGLASKDPKAPGVEKQNNSITEGGTTTGGGNTTPPGGGTDTGSDGGVPPVAGNDQRPGWGYGDPNHDHTGPPGQVGYNPMTPNFPGDKVGGGGPPADKGPANTPPAKGKNK